MANVSIGALTRRLRLWSGLVLFTFITTHFVNHALGMISLETAEAGRGVFLGFWRNPLGTALLYPSFAVHVALVLWALYQRRSLRLPRWELIRLALGLAMPLLLIPHIFGTRILNLVFGGEDTYAYVVAGMWVLHIDGAITQTVLLVIAWVHGCMGIHFWLKVKPWYPRALPLLRGAALLLPVLALIGFSDIGRELAAQSSRPGWWEAVSGGITEHQEETVLLRGQFAIAFFVSVVALVFVGRRVRDAVERRRGTVRLTYPGGRRVEVAQGTTVLEASRAGGIPHASVCGGRGRCSTCRSRIGEGWEALPRPSVDEARVLKRVGAPPNVRLACQVKPQHDLEVFPLLPPTASPPDGFSRPSYTYGNEQEIAILFADIRSFTQFSEHRLPFDVVFVLNRYFTAMGQAIGQSGGLLDKFIGDGVMALFGLESGPARGCREALAGAMAMAEALDGLNKTLEHDLAEPLRIGIGIHVGPVIVGEMGHARATTLTAIGDAVNTASRLESLNKEYKSQLIVSEDVASHAGVDLSTFPSYEIEVRGRTTAMRIRVIEQATLLAPLLAEPAASRA